MRDNKQIWKRSTEPAQKKTYGKGKRAVSVLFALFITVTSP